MAGTSWWSKGAWRGVAQAFPPALRVENAWAVVTHRAADCPYPFLTVNALSGRDARAPLRFLRVTLRCGRAINPAMTKLTPTQIKAALPQVPAWKRTGAVISRTFAFENFPVAIKFVNAVAKLAEKANHHPDIDIRWNKVTLALTTHDAGGLTEKDFALATRFDGLV